ncbi:M20/M25/M40 family metallo-hydrolase [Actinoplanes sp. NPDC051851]|uniref:M20/M25/M40 family metallo-hydrolase n=1 Tax=Actinoplanes sp. NPDC051851 TaxID=3154753 RepID=UPI0034130C86
MERLRRYTACESPTGDARALSVLADVLDEDARRAGFETARERHPTGDHLIWTRPATGADRGRILVLSHYDTVWPAGTLKHMPWTVEGDVIRGPGVYDTKAGLVALLDAVTAIDRHPEIRVLVIADEEVGSPTARELVTAEARAARAVLGMEPPHPGGDLKTARRGSTRARIEVTGVEAHAALDPEGGVNAIDELVDQLVRFRARIAEYPVLVNTGTVSGGGRTNVVAGSAHADLGFRFVDQTSERAVLAELESLEPVRKGATVGTRLLSRRPTWPADGAGAGLLAAITAIAAGIGQTIGGRAADGAADTNTTGALGCPTVDGLGPAGGGAHARTEWVSITGIRERTALLAALLTEL